jgi:hypothetical protein
MFFFFTDYEKKSGEVITCHFHDGLMAFCDFARLSRKPKETLEGHYEKERRRDDAENGVFERGRKVEPACAGNDGKPSFGRHFSPLFQE